MCAKKVSNIRNQKMKSQSGRCYYCKRPMWVGDLQKFCQSLGLSPKQARLFQCTAEHLKPKSEGGGDTKDNLVAACKFCNQTRHVAKTPLSHSAYLVKVRKRLFAGKWNS
jgi:5-methylcytosine-specific restriction endonuclease McrA